MLTPWYDRRERRKLFLEDRERWARDCKPLLIHATEAGKPKDQRALELPHSYIAGSLGTRITIHDQQWLGIELAEAAWRDRFYPNLPVGIVGAGFAGTAAALWLLRCVEDKEKAFAAPIARASAPTRSRRCFSLRAGSRMDNFSFNLRRSGDMPAL